MFGLVEWLSYALGRHRGVRFAALLSFVAGMAAVTGWLMLGGLFPAIPPDGRPIIRLSVLERAS
jgi:hypothetical protein